MARLLIALSIFLMLQIVLGQQQQGNSKSGSKQHHGGRGHHRRECGPPPQGLEGCDWHSCSKPDCHETCQQPNVCCPTACCQVTCQAPVSNPSRIR